MTKVLSAFALYLVTAVFLAALASAADTNPFEKASVWKGSITQGNTNFPATFQIAPLGVGQRLKGEITFTIDGTEMKLKFQGTVRKVGGQRIIAVITDKVSGDVTYPGLYVGSLHGNLLAGTWEVPSAGQFDTFAVRLVE